MAGYGLALMQIQTQIKALKHAWFPAEEQEQSV